MPAPPPRVGEPDLSPCAALVRDLDPDLFRAALFAREPLREAVMVLLAFDVELSKATARASEPIIAAMRLQWWRDVVGEAFGDAPPRAHEVAGPLTALIRDHALPEALFDRLFTAREAELHAPMSADAFAAWLRDRTAPLLALVGHAALHPPFDGQALEAVGQAMALSFALRNAVAMAGEGAFLLPVAGLDRAALARGETTASARDVVRRLAEETAQRLSLARQVKPPHAIRPILRLGWKSTALLRHAQQPGFEIRDARRLSTGGTGWLLLLALTGRW